MRRLASCEDRFPAKPEDHIKNRNSEAIHLDSLWVIVE